MKKISVECGKNTLLVSKNKKVKNFLKNWKRVFEIKEIIIKNQTFSIEELENNRQLTINQLLLIKN